MTDHAPKLAALLAYQADELSVRGRGRVEAHLASCAVCREALASMRVYDGLVADVRAAPVPEPDWSRMELALRREARAASGRTTGSRALWIGLAVAAAALLAFALLPERDRTRVEAPVLVPSAPDELAAREPIRGEVTALVDGVTGGAGDTLEPIVLGAEVAEGMRLVTADPAEAHVRFYDGTAAMIGQGSEVRIAELRRGRVVMDLSRGSVSNVVASLGDGDVYEVHADPYVVQVRGTKFVVVHGDGGTAVTVDEGVVAVLRDGELVELLEAPASWRSSDGVQAVPAGAVSEPVGATADAAGWPALRLARVTWVTSWHVGARELPPGELAMRVPPGTLHVEGRGDRSKVWRAELVMGPLGQTIDEGEIRPAAPAVRVGELAPELIAPVVRNGQRQLRRCQQDVDRETGITVTGNFTLRVTIGRTGEVQRAELVPVRASETPPAFEQCILDRVRGWTFPPPTGGIVTFEQPLNYSTTPTHRVE